MKRLETLIIVLAVLMVLGLMVFIGRMFITLEPVKISKATNCPCLDQGRVDQFTKGLKK